MRALFDDVGLIVSVENMRTLGYPGDDLAFAPHLLLLDLLKTAVGRFFVYRITTFTQTSGV